MPATQAPKLLRIGEAAERLNVSRASVYRWIEEGRLPAVQLGGSGSPLRVPAGELQEWLALSHVTPAERRTRRGAVDCTAACGEGATMNPYELLAQRHREYANARERHVRALAKQAAAQERVQALERELADAEDVDRRTLGDALVDGKKPPARKTGQARASLQQAKSEVEALAYACERAGQELDGMPAARRGDWLPQAKRDFEAARADYEKRLALLIEAHQRLAQEATLVDFLAAGSSISMAPILHVCVGGVEGLVRDVPVIDVLAALREQMFDLEADVLLGAKA